MLERKAWNKFPRYQKLKFTPAPYFYDAPPFLMKYRLSHQWTDNIQLTGMAIFGALPWLVAFILYWFFPLIWCVLAALLLNCLTFLFSLRLYKAEFDLDFLYLTRRLLKKKIGLKGVDEIKTFPFPVYFYLSHAYFLSIRYNEAGTMKRAFLISRGKYLGSPRIDNIFEIAFFRKFVQNKKRELWLFSIQAKGSGSVE